MIPGIIAICLALIGFTAYKVAKGSKSEINIETLTVPVEETRP